MRRTADADVGPTRCCRSNVRSSQPRRAQIDPKAPQRLSTTGRSKACSAIRRGRGWEFEQEVCVYRKAEAQARRSSDRDVSKVTVQARYLCTAGRLICNSRDRTANSVPVLLRDACQAV
jgi:hypothetical protein